MIVGNKILLENARRGGYAVPAFNVDNLESVLGVLHAAENTDRPVIIQTIPRTLRYGGIPVYSMETLSDYIKEHGCDIAVIATQKGVAADIAARLVALGVKSIWNFAPIDLDLPDDVAVENIAMSESLYVLSYRMKNKQQ